jgi:hypothetical protein
MNDHDAALPQAPPPSFAIEVVEADPGECECALEDQDTGDDDKDPQEVPIEGMGGMRDMGLGDRDGGHVSDGEEWKDRGRSTGFGVGCGGCASECRRR